MSAAKAELDALVPNVQKYTKIVCIVLKFTSVANPIYLLFILISKKYKSFTYSESNIYINIKI